MVGELCSVALRVEKYGVGRDRLVMSNLKRFRSNSPQYIGLPQSLCRSSCAKCAQKGGCPGALEIAAYADRGGKPLLSRCLIFASQTSTGNPVARLSEQRSDTQVLPPPGG
jgi:hypothetical protein